MKISTKIVKRTFFFFLIIERQNLFIISTESVTNTRDVSNNASMIDTNTDGKEEEEEELDKRPSSPAPPTQLSNVNFIFFIYFSN